MNYKQELWYNVGFTFLGSNIPWVFDLPDIKNPALSFLSVNCWGTSSNGAAYVPSFVHFASELFDTIMQVSPDPTMIGPATYNGTVLAVNDKQSWRGLLPLTPSKRYQFDMWAVPIDPSVAFTQYEINVNYALSYDQ